MAGPQPHAELIAAARGFLATRLYDAEEAGAFRAVIDELAKGAPLSSDTIVAANVFLGHMADRYRERTGVSAEVAMQYALATFDASAEMTGVPFGHPDHTWDGAAAAELVDEDLRHWDTA